MAFEELVAAFGAFILAGTFSKQYIKLRAPLAIAEIINNMPESNKINNVA